MKKILATGRDQIAEYANQIEVVAVDTTVVFEDSGTLFHIATDALTMTLPAVAAANMGMVVGFMNIGADGNNIITISPNASDAIFGSYSSNGILTSMTGTDNKDIVNTKATAKKGDYIWLRSDGSTGWYIEKAEGVWTEEDQTAGGVNPGYTLLDDDVTLTVAQSGQTFGIATDAKTITLPPTVAGVKYTIINTGADGNNIITISPAVADGIFGTLTLAASVVQMAGTANTDVINTKATALKGDSITLVGDGVDGWAIVASTGIWASA